MIATLAGLEQRDRTGKGQYIDLSMQDISCWLTQTTWNTDITRIARATVLPVKDGFVAVETSDAGIADRPNVIEALSLPRSDADRVCRETRSGCGG